MFAILILGKNLIDLIFALRLSPISMVNEQEAELLDMNVSCKLSPRFVLVDPSSVLTVSWVRSSFLDKPCNLYEDSVASVNRGGTVHCN